MTDEQFRRFQMSRQFHDCLEAANPDAFGCKAGYAYLNNELYIDDTTSWKAEECRGGTLPKHRWFLCIANREWASDTLEELERILCQWALDEGYMP